MPAHFGLDISTSSIKVVEVRKNNNESYDLRAFGEIRTPAYISSHIDDDVKEIALSIDKLLNNAKIKSNKVHIAIPDSESYSRVIQTPILSDNELKSAIQYEAEQYIPFRIDEIYLEHQVLFRPPKNIKDMKMEVLLVAAKKVAVDNVMKILNKINLTPIVLETSLMASIRALKSQISDYSMLVDIGDASTDIVIVQNGIVQQVSSIATAGQALTRAIAQGLSLSEKQARQYKHVYGLEKDQLEGKVAMAMRLPINQIVNHINKNIRYVKNLGGNHRIDQVIISGGTALLPNMSHYLVDELNVEVALANPFQNCKNNNLPQELIAAAPRFTAAIGLALRD